MVESTREFSRIPLHVKVCLSFDDGAKLQGEGTDLSLKGVFCKTSGTSHVGLRCDVTLTFDAGDTQLSVLACGSVVRVGDSGVAVEFDKLDLESYHHLKNLIRFNTQDPETVDREFAAHIGLKRREE